MPANQRKVREKITKGWELSMLGGESDTRKEGRRLLEKSIRNRCVGAKELFPLVGG